MLRKRNWILVGFAFLLTGCLADEPLYYGFNGSGPTPYNLEIPSNFPGMVIPADNPMTVEGVRLGRRLFYEPMLSADGTQSCSSCHDQAHAFSDTTQYSLGIDGGFGDKNAMAVINLGWSQEFFWNGREVGLEDHALQPVINPVEMHNSWGSVEIFLNSDTTYQRMFREAFGVDEITQRHAVKAIAQFERTMISGNSRYDQYMRGNQSVLTTLERQGLDLFFTEKAECFHCHTEILMMDNQYHNNGLDMNFPEVNWGRFAVTGDSSHLGMFRTPTLRNIELTGPYMHDGRFETIEEVIEHYSSQIKITETVNPLLRRPGGLGLDPSEKVALAAFLRTLTDTTFTNNPAFSDPF
ncbi:MAG TPA: cytochrome-c peroxidase [Bacteroidetes bacterium]|nr:cytochrome-c peroxidase [Bacteroidota bacterium]